MLIASAIFNNFMPFSPGEISTSHLRKPVPARSCFYFNHRPRRATAGRGNSLRDFLRDDLRPPRRKALDSTAMQFCVNTETIFEWRFIRIARSGARPGEVENKKRLSGPGVEKLFSTLDRHRTGRFPRPARARESITYDPFSTTVPLHVKLGDFHISSSTGAPSDALEIKS